MLTTNIDNDCHLELRVCLNSVFCYCFLMTCAALSAPQLGTVQRQQILLRVARTSSQTIESFWAPCNVLAVSGHSPSCTGNWGCTHRQSWYGLTPEVWFVWIASVSGFCTIYSLWHSWETFAWFCYTCPRLGHVHIIYRAWRVMMRHDQPESLRLSRNSEMWSTTTQKQAPNSGK